MKKILYIGNKLATKGNTLSTIESLGSNLREEGFAVKTASSQKNKGLRMLAMIKAVFNNRKWADVPILHGGNLPSRLQKSKKQSRKLFGNAKTNVAPSNYLLEAFKKAGYTNLTYIPNTIEIENYPFLFRKNIKPKLLWVRSFSEIYNPMLAIYVLENLLSNGYNDAELCMIGPEKDDSYKMCKSYAEKHNLPINFTGSLPKTEWIEQSKKHDIFINTTNVDNTPVSVIEAMALGLPIVSTNVGGVPFLIKDKKDGLLVTPNDVKAFSKQIINLLNDSGKVELLTVNARKKVEQFDWNIVKQKWKTLLNS